MSRLIGTRMRPGAAMAIGLLWVPPVFAPGGAMLAGQLVTTAMPTIPWAAARWV